MCSIVTQVLDPEVIWVNLFKWRNNVDLRSIELLRGGRRHADECSARRLRRSKSREVRLGVELKLLRPEVLCPLRASG